MHLLLNCGANTNSKDAEEASPLHAACMGCNPAPVVQIPSQARYQPQQRQSRRPDTPTHHLPAGLPAQPMVLQAHDRDQAAGAGGARVNQHDNNDSTPLHFACKNGLCKIVKVLLELGADVRLRDQLGRTVIFDILECLRRRRCLAMLAAITARCTAQNPLDVLNISDHEGRAPIHDVSESGDCLVARRLHSAGADMNLRDGVGMLLLHHAANGNVGNRGSVSADASSAGSWHQAAGTALYVFYHRPAGDTSNNSFKLRR